jgi:hypothetical protein
MPNRPPALSRNSDSRDTLDVSLDELQRPSQLPLIPPLPAVESTATKAPESLPPTWLDASESERLPNGWRIPLVFACALMVATPLLISGASKLPRPSQSPAVAARPSVSASIAALAASTSAAPITENPDLSCSEATALVPEQFIELGSVCMTRPSTTALESSDRAVSADLSACGLGAKAR